MNIAHFGAKEWLNLWEKRQLAIFPKVHRKLGFIHILSSSFKFFLIKISYISLYFCCSNDSFKYKQSVS